jgi:hypothetical protein
MKHRRDMQKDIILNGVDVAKGVQNCSNDKQLYLEVLFKFRDNYYDVKDQINIMHNAHDISGIKILLHTLKGILNTIGAFRIYGKINYLERTGILNILSDDDFILLNEIYLDLEFLFCSIKELED